MRTVEEIVSDILRPALRAAERRGLERGAEIASECWYDDTDAPKELRRRIAGKIRAEAERSG